MLRLSAGPLDLLDLHHAAGHQVLAPGFVAGQVVQDEEKRGGWGLGGHQRVGDARARSQTRDAVGVAAAVITV